MEYDAATLPWTDRPDFAQGLKKRLQIGEITGDEATMLNDWNKNGFVVFPKAIPDSLTDQLMEDYERAWVERPTCMLLAEEQGVTMLSESRPREELLSHHYRMMDFHSLSAAGLEIMMHSKILRSLSLIFGEKPYAMQSLLFEYGSEQDLHQDFPFVAPQIFSHLVGAWVACEDADPSNGGLLYYPGSHRVPKFNFGYGSIAYTHHEEHKEGVFAEHLKRECERMGLREQILWAKKGDVLLWHSALVHAGSKVEVQRRTRKSFVTHYSTERGYPFDRRSSNKTPLMREKNGGVYYAWDHPDHIEGRYPLR